MKHILLFALGAATLFAADATGRWSGTLTDDVRAQPAYLILQQNGEALTGSAGANLTDQQPIEKGKAVDGTLTFEIRGGVMKVVLKQDGDEIRGEVRRQIEGRSQTATLVMKREK